MQWTFGLVGGLLFLAIINGVASAALAVSAFTLVVPILMIGYQLSACDALVMSFALDCVNGFIVFYMYKKFIPQNTTRYVFIGSILSSISAVAICCVWGLYFIQSHESRLREGAGYISYWMAFLFTIKGYRGFREHQRIEHLATQFLHSHGHSSHELDEEHDIEFTNDEENGAHYHDEWHVSHVKDDKFTETWLFKVASVIYFFSLSLFSGTFGFGGGNGYALYYLVGLKWSVLASTSASGLMSGCVMLSLIATYISYDVIMHRGRLLLILAIMMPVDIVANLYTCTHAKHSKDYILMLSIAVIFVAIGTIATVFATEEN